MLHISINFPIRQFRKLSNGNIQFLKQAVPVLGQRALEGNIIGNMIAPKKTVPIRRQLNMAEEGPHFFGQATRRKQLKFAFFKLP